jgi:hypothetical protein
MILTLFPNFPLVQKDLKQPHPVALAQVMQGGLSSLPVLATFQPPVSGTRDWKVPRTRRQECLRYRAALRAEIFGGRQREFCGWKTGGERGIRTSRFCTPIKGNLTETPE